MSEPTQSALLDGVDIGIRRAFDYYPTPAWMTLALIKRVPVCGYVLEPCSGQNAIANVIRGRAGVLYVETNDLDPTAPAMTHQDAARPAYWQALAARTHNRVDIGITNVPFVLADAIVPQAVRTLSVFATVLRLSWLEPTEARGEWLQENPPTRVIVMPRHDFKGNGKTDSVTSAWFVWECYGTSRGVDIVSKAERDHWKTQANAVSA